ncbi:MAG: hypothetical protein U9R42_13695 [Bacteroidota bacterium]|nr:hypothetical protein [Bacteroidota bacterium]
MTKSKYQNLHDDHANWKEMVNNWKNEIDKFNKVLLAEALENQPKEHQEKLIKYDNHLKHNKRFLQDLLETIDTHELFLDELVEFNNDIDNIPLDAKMDHDKTANHIKDFEKRYTKLKSKIKNIIKNEIVNS